MATDMTVPTEIARQITTMTKMAIGYRKPMGDEKSLTFAVGDARKLQKITITLLPSDTYKVELIRMGTARNGYKCTVLETKEDIYVDNLNEVLYHMVNK